MPERRYYVLLNPNSGTVKALGITGALLSQVFAEHGLDATIDADAESSVDARIERAVASDADVIVAAGGDGTATAIANHVLDTGKTLAILPLGTFNLLAKDLKLPSDLQAWAAALPAMEPRAIDVGVVNDRIFLHKTVIGLMPDLAAGRERVRGGGIRAQLGYLRYFVRRVARSRRIALEIKTDTGEIQIERVHAVGVASNAYDEGVGRFMTRQTLDSGLLTLYKVRRLSVIDLVRLVTGMIAGHWQRDPSLAIQVAHGVSIRSRKPRLQVMIDGEVENLETPLHFSIRHKALAVLAPATLTSASTAEPAKNPGV